MAEGLVSVAPTQCPQRQEALAAAEGTASQARKLLFSQPLQVLPRELQGSGRRGLGGGVGWLQSCPKAPQG